MILWWRREVKSGKRRDGSAFKGSASRSEAGNFCGLPGSWCGPRVLVGLTGNSVIRQTEDVKYKSGKSETVYGVELAIGEIEFGSSMNLCQLTLPSHRQLKVNRRRTSTTIFVCNMVLRRSMYHKHLDRPNSGYRSIWSTFVMWYTHHCSGAGVTLVYVKWSRARCTAVHAETWFHRIVQLRRV